MSQPGQTCILVVDDHADTVDMLRRFLTRVGYHVVTASSAAEAMPHLDRCKLIISDVGLPARGGLDLMRDVRKQYSLRGIALSGHAAARDEAAARAAGFDRFLPKPVEFGSLLAAVSELV